MNDAQVVLSNSRPVVQEAIVTTFMGVRNILFLKTSKRLEIHFRILKRKGIKCNNRVRVFLYDYKRLQ